MERRMANDTSEEKLKVQTMKMNELEAKVIQLTADNHSLKEDRNREWNSRNRIESKLRELTTELKEMWIKYDENEKELIK